MKTFLIWLVILTAYFYAEHILSTILKIRKANILMNKFSKINPELDQDELAATIKRTATPNMPIINELLPYNWDSIQLNQSTTSTIDSFRNILSSLQSELYALDYELKKSVNPIYALKKLFLLPSQILAWFGFKLTVKSERILSILFWVGGYIANNYGKEMISFIINNFVNHK